MTKTFSLPPDSAAYLEALRAELADLPADERDELLADVETSMIEAAEEGEEGISDRLGPPSLFAEELRVAAGIQGHSPTHAGQASALDSVVAVIRRLLADPRMEGALRLAGEFAPIWWLLRAYVAAAAIAWAADSWSTEHPAVPRFGSVALSVVVFVAFAAISLWLGVRGRRIASGTPAQRALVLLNLALAGTAIPVAVHALDTRAPIREIVVAVPAEPQAGLTKNGAPLRNIFPYTRDGRLLHDVLLYDEFGQPINLGGPGFPDPNRRVLVTAGGARLYNSFPVRYFEPHSRKVAHPNAGPSVKLPRVVTPPLATPLKRHGAKARTKSPRRAAPASR